MAFQVVFVVESDERSRSDIIYIRSIMDHLYNFRIRSDVKISEVFMAGKGNYNKNKIINSIRTKIKQYKTIGETYVIYCFDTDKYDSDPNDKKVLKDEKEFCRDNGYEFVWFCHDVEEVFLGHSVPKGEKTDWARKYIASDWIKMVNIDNLKSDVMVKGRSNIMTVLGKIFRFVT